MPGVPICATPSRESRGLLGVASPSRREFIDAVTVDAYGTDEEVRRAVIEFIEIFYNRQRLHSSLGYLTPVEYEEQIQQYARPEAA